jgi:hypothetical protein
VFRGKRNTVQSAEADYWRRYGRAYPQAEYPAVRQYADWVNGTVLDLLAHADLQQLKHAVGVLGGPDPAQLVVPARDSRTMPIYCGRVQTGVFNAFTRRAKSGYLITITDRLIHMMQECCQVLAAAMPYEGAGSESAPAIDADEALQRYEEAIIIALTGMHTDLAPLRLGPIRAEEALNYLSLTTEFILAHETAHILLGHLGGRDTDAPVSFRSVEELEADQVGQMLISWSNNDQNDEYQFFGVIIWSEIFDTLEVSRLILEEKGVEALFARAAQDHPHPALRRSNAITAAHPLGEFASLPMCDSLLSAFDIVRRRLHPQRSAQALQAVEDLSREADDAVFERLVLGGGQVAGVRILRQDDLTSLMATDVHTAIVYTSKAAHLYMATLMLPSRATNVRKQIWLAYFYRTFSVQYLTEPKKNWNADIFDRTLRHAIPELDEIINLTLQVALDVHG